MKQVHSIRIIIAWIISIFYFICSCLAAYALVYTFPGGDDTPFTKGTVAYCMSVIGIPGGVLILLAMLLIAGFLFVGAIEWLYTGKFFD